MRTLNTGCRVGILLLMLALACFADNVVYDPGTTYIIDPELTGYSTYGDQMAGMRVTAWWQSGASVTAIWTATGSGAGAAAAADLFSVSLSGDSWNSPWSLTNLAASQLTRLLLDGPPGLTVFDTVPYIDGTPGSAQGWAFQRLSGASDVVATYRNKAAVIGNPVQGDLYTQLDLAITGLDSGDIMTWRSDTDSVPSGGSVNPVPEPATVALLGFAVATLGVLSRRKRA
ncbi:MAG: PEP-CTERM sorting domain-containing protein [Bryobacteraceae bacterium]